MLVYRLRRGLDGASADRLPAKLQNAAPLAARGIACRACRSCSMSGGCRMKPLYLVCSAISVAPLVSVVARHRQTGTSPDAPAIEIGPASPAPWRGRMPRASFHLSLTPHSSFVAEDEHSEGARLSLGLGLATLPTDPGWRLARRAPSVRRP